MPQAGQIIPEHLYPHNMVVVNDNTGYTQELPEAEDTSIHMLFVFASPMGIDNQIQDITGGLSEFVSKYGQGPFSLYGQPYLNAYNAHKSGYITGHCLRVTADNATYASVVLVALYKVDESGKMTVKFKTRTPKDQLTDLDDMDNLYTAPTEALSDGDDAGYTEVKLMTIAALGRGSYGKKLQVGITTNTGGDKENEYKNYVVQVYENFGTLTQKESWSVCLSEDAIVDDEAKFIDGIIESNSTRIKTLTNAAGLQQIVNAYNDANADSTFTIDDFDVLLGIDKYTRNAINNYEIDSMSDGVVVLNATGGIALEGGDDGDLADSADAATRKAALEAAYLKAFQGEIDPMIASRNKYPCNLILDANYPVETKQAIAALVEKRTDCAGYLDCGLEIKSLRSPLTYVKNNLDSYVRNRNEEIVGICGKVRDPYSKKLCTVTVTYALAYNLPVQWAENGGKHIPYAGNAYGIIDTDFVANSIYPVYDESLNSDLMDELCEERINFAQINANQRTVIATQTTRQVASSNLSEMNNVMILLDIKRDCEKLCSTYHYNFSEAADIARFNRDAESVVSKYEAAQVRSITASFDKNDWEAERGILHLYVAMEHKDLVKSTIIEIDVNRGSTSTSN